MRYGAWVNGDSNITTWFGGRSWGAWRPFAKRSRPCKKYRCPRNLGDGQRLQEPSREQILAQIANQLGQRERALFAICAGGTRGNSWGDQAQNFSIFAVSTLMVACCRDRGSVSGAKRLTGNSSAKESVKSGDHSACRTKHSSASGSEIPIHRPEVP